MLQPSGRSSQMNILVVDDEPEFRLLMKSFLAQEGWEVHVAENGQHALEKLAAEKFDLVISDVYMPIMDGIRLHRSVREMPGFERLPFLFVSAYDDQHTLDAVKDPRIEGFFRKGKSVANLKEWIVYLTTPEDKRPKLPPGDKSAIPPQDGYRGGGGADP
jgi:two-component system chemotaxis response regulator CheY